MIRNGWQNIAALSSAAMTRIAACVAAAATALVLASGGSDAAPLHLAQVDGGDQTAAVQVDKVGVQPLTQTVPVIGRLVARRTGVVASRAAGPVAEMRVEVGDRVENGDILAVLVTDALVARRDLAQAELKITQQELARLELLRRSKSAAFTASRYEDATQEVVKARASLRLVEINLYNAEIRAPYAGVVSVRHTEVGAYVSLGDPVVALVNDAEMEVEADVPAHRIGGLEPGAKVALQFSDNSRHQATVRAVVPSENPRTRTRAVRFVPEFEIGTVSLAANQSVTVFVPLGASRQVVSVHKDAIINRGGRKLVYLVDGDSAQIRPVELGESVGSRFEVLSGLKPGDLVVVRGNERLLPGQKIRYERGS